MTSTKVLYGPFIGYTKADLLPLLTAAQEAFAAGDSKITGAAVGGQSFGRTAGMSASERIRQIVGALAQVDPDYLAPANQVYARMSDPGLGPCVPWP